MILYVVSMILNVILWTIKNTFYVSKHYGHLIHYTGIVFQNIIDT